MIRKLAIALIAIALVSPTAMAGYSPGWDTSEPVEVLAGVDDSRDLLVVSNYEDANDNVQIKVTGNLSNYVEPTTSSFTLAPNGKNGDRRDVTLQISGLEVGDRVDGAITIKHSPENSDTNSSSGASAETRERVSMEITADEPDGNLVAGLFSLPFIGAVTIEMLLIFMVALIALFLIWLIVFDGEDYLEEKF